MKRAAYRDAVKWIALEDNAGSDDTHDEIEKYTTTCLIADIFAVETRKVADDVYRQRVYARNDKILKRNLK